MANSPRIPERGHRELTPRPQRMLRSLRLAVFPAVLLATTAAVSADDWRDRHEERVEPVVLKTQGSFLVGGAVVTNPGTFDPIALTPDGQTIHGDHAYAQYQIPLNARRYPLVMWHGGGQFSKTWETTPDGRDGCTAAMPGGRRPTAPSRLCRGPARPASKASSSAFAWASGRITSRGCSSRMTLPRSISGGVSRPRTRRRRATMSPLRQSPPYSTRSARRC